MADNYTFTEGSGKTGASDDIGSVHYPRIKVSWGADGSATDTSTAAPFPVRATAGTIGDGRKVVTTSGTEVALAASTACLSVTITAELDNTDVIVVGSASIVATLATRQGTPLAPGESITLAIDNLSKVFIDAMVSGEGVTFSYLAI